MSGPGGEITILIRPHWADLSDEQRLSVVAEGLKQGQSIRQIARLGFADGTAGRVAGVVQRAGGVQALKTRFSDPVAESLFTSRTDAPPEGPARQVVGDPRSRAALRLPDDGVARCQLAARIRDKAASLISRSYPRPAIECALELAALIEHHDRHYPAVQLAGRRR